MTTERTPAEHRACDSPTLICPHALTRCGGFVQERHVKHCRVCQNPWPCDASLYATQLAEAQAQVATLVALWTDANDDDTTCVSGCDCEPVEYLRNAFAATSAAVSQWQTEVEQRAVERALSRITPDLIHDLGPVELDGGVPDVCNRYEEHELFAAHLIALLSTSEAPVADSTSEVTK